MSVSSFVKSLRNTMWKDPGASSDLQRLPQLSWLLFLRVYDERESEWEVMEEGFVSILPERCRWRNWAHDRKDGRALTGDALVAFVNDDLIPTLRSLPVSADTPVRKAIVRQMFADATNYMKDGVLLRQVVNLVDEIDFGDYAEQHAFNEMYESILKLMQGSKATGEFYTPRAVTDFVVGRVAPRIGESVADFACGTGGFLVSALNFLMPQQRSVEDVAAFDSSVFGVEWKSLPFQMCLTNLLLHGVNSPNLRNGDALSRDVREYSESERFDVVVMNPPYGGNTASNTLLNFPADCRTSETAFLFVVLILYRLRESGRAGVVVSDGFLEATGGAESAIKERLLRECNLHTVVRLPGSVFAPYTSIATNLLFFERSGPTRETWFYRLDMPEGYKNFSKTRPILLEHFAGVVEGWDHREEIVVDGVPKAMCVSAEEIARGNFRLSFCGFPQEVEEVLDPFELMSRYERERSECSERVERILADIREILERR